MSCFQGLRYQLVLWKKGRVIKFTQEGLLEDELYILYHFVAWKEKNFTSILENLEFTCGIACNTFDSSEALTREF